MNKFCPYCGQPTNTGGMCPNWKCNSYFTQEITHREQCNPAKIDEIKIEVCYLIKGRDQCQKCTR